MTSVSTNRLYYCPGEEHPIPRSVHLARLASFFPKCRDCALRCDTGELGTGTIKRLQQTESRVARSSLMVLDGARGVHLNELDRRWAAEAASAFSSLLWEQTPLIPAVRRNESQRSNSSEQIARVPVRPSVILGFDERPSSPDLVRGVLSALRRTGCQVIDVGLLTRPQFALAAHHLESSGGLYVTGAGYAPAWTGIDFVAQDAQPVSRFELSIDQAGQDESNTGDDSVWALRRGVPTLDLIEERMQSGSIRYSRHAGSTRTFRIQRIYESHLEKHFHGLRAFRVAIGVVGTLQRQILQTLFSALPCELHLCSLPRRQRDPADPQDPDCQRMRQAVRESDSDLGFLIDEDGQKAIVLDESGDVVPQLKLVESLVRVIVEESPDRPLIVPASFPSATRQKLRGQASQLIESGRHSMSAQASLMRRHHAGWSLDEHGRHWFHDGFPSCDAILMLARLLNLLSRNDQRLSEL